MLLVKRDDISLLDFNVRRHQFQRERRIEKKQLKKLVVQRNTTINKKRNRVITLDLIRPDRKSKSEAKVS